MHKKDEKVSKVTDIIKVKQRTIEQRINFVCIHNSDKVKYGSLSKLLSRQFALGQDQYPRDMVLATNMLSNHKFAAHGMDIIRK